MGSRSNNKKKIGEHSGKEVSPKQFALAIAWRVLIIYLIVIIVFLILLHTVWGVYIVKGSSMEPTLSNNELFITNWKTENLQRFDIVIICLPNENIVKRVVGLPGETVQIVDGCLTINGEVIKDVTSITMTYAGIAAEPITLGEGEYFVLGDNREHSSDSRDPRIGIIQHEWIIGKVIWHY